MSEQRNRGLTSTQVEQSRARYGDNRLKKQKRTTFWAQFIGNFGDPIIKVLLSVLAINLVFLFRNQNWYEIVGIAIAVLLATLVSTVCEYGSEAAFEKLQEEASRIRCRVRRNGQLQQISPEDLVVGDIVLLQAGEAIPADGILCEGELQVDQSALNGESHEIKKTPVNTISEDPLLQYNALFRGSIVCAGEGILEVTAVGGHTFYGNVAKEIQDETRESPLKLRLAVLASKLSKLGFAAAACVAFADLFHAIVMENQYTWSLIREMLMNPSQILGCILHAAMLALTVVVVAVPEGLPMMITVVLSSNMRRMLKDHVLVRKLVGIETSGSLNILFTDKTGTLTEGKPSVSVFIDGSGTMHQHRNSLIRSPLWQFLSLSAYYNSDAGLSGKEIIGGNSTDKALLSYAHGRQPFNTNCTVVHKVPFDSSQKWSGVEITGDVVVPEGMKEGHLTLIKGAPDKLLSMCSSYVDITGKIRPFDSQSAVYTAQKKQEEDAMRMIVIALSPIPLDGFPKKLILLGMFGLRDELRSDVRHAVLDVQNAGIQVVMMTGDSPQTATAIAKRAGIIPTHSQTGLVLTSQRLSQMSDEEISELLPSLRVIARALPSDKSRLVKIAQNRGLVVGMTGDGINDAPALKKADVGFSMGSGTEVAKQASDIVILNNCFSAIAKAILYGRTIFKSIRKFIVFQLTMNLCAVGISLIGPFIGVETPVTVMQMLWINIIMDTLAGLAFAGEPPLAEYMRESPKKRTEPILNRYMINQIVCTGCFTVLLCTAFLKCDFFKMRFGFEENPLYWMTAFFALFIFCSVFNCFNARTTRLNLLAHLRTNKPFLLIVTVIAAVQVGLIYYGGTLFRTTPLSAKTLLKIIALSASVLPFDWFRKIILRSQHRKGTL